MLKIVLLESAMLKQNLFYLVRICKIHSKFCATSEDIVFANLMSMHWCLWLFQGLSYFWEVGPKKQLWFGTLSSIYNIVLPWTLLFCVLFVDLSLRRKLTFHSCCFESMFSKYSWCTYHWWRFSMTLISKSPWS